MTGFHGGDGSRLAYHRAGSEGPVVVCIPGGPMQSSAYLGDLGGLSARLSLVLLDPRGTGGSAIPDDPTTYRCDRQVDDVESLREHLGLESLDLLAHSAGANVAVAYAAQHPHRIQRLALIAPSVRAVDLVITDDDRRELAELRRGERWFSDAYAAFERIWAGDPTPDDWAGITPFVYGRWDDAARAHAAASDAGRHDAAAAVFGSAGAFDPEGARTALAELAAPVLVLAGEYDVGCPPRVAAEYAALVRHAELIVQPGAGHSPWVDGPQWFGRTLEGFFARAAAP